MTRRDEEEVVTSRAADLAILRALEEAEQASAGKANPLLRDLAQAAAFRQRAAIGVTVMRRPK